jgi:hypothetical protein
MIEMERKKLVLEKDRLFKLSRCKTANLSEPDKARLAELEEKDSLERTV